MSLAARVPAERLALIAALTTVVLWASAFVGIRAASVDLTAGPLALGRLLVGSLALGVLVLTRGFVRPSRRDFLLIVASGLLWFAFYNVALNEAERNVDAGTASMLTNIGPILVACSRACFSARAFRRGSWPVSASRSSARSSSRSPRPPRPFPAAMRRWGSPCASRPRSPTRAASRSRSRRSARCPRHR